MSCHPHAFQLRAWDAQHRRDTESIHTLYVIRDLDICGHDGPVHQYRLTASCQLSAAEGCEIIEIVPGVLRRQECLLDKKSKQENIRHEENIMARPKSQR